MSEAILQSLTEFGAAGLIGMMWLIERGRGAKRDRQLDDTHRRLMAQRRDLMLWMRLVERNTRALKALEVGQREAIRLLRRWRRQQNASREKV